MISIMLYLFELNISIQTMNFLEYDKSSFGLLLPNSGGMEVKLRKTSAYCSIRAAIFTIFKHFLGLATQCIKINVKRTSIETKISFGFGISTT